MSWSNAGGLIVSTDGIGQIGFGKQLRADGFAWVALRIADGKTLYPPTASWIALFRASSGLPVGAWSVLRDDPVAEAQIAASAIAADHLDFYIANAEEEYGYTIGTRQDPATFARSRAFVTAFRAAEPTLPAALASYCRPDQHDLDWATWANAGFDFLPEAYVDQLGGDAIPSACVTAGLRWFPRSRIHPILGVFSSTYPTPDPAHYAQLLAQAHTVGFSLYPAWGDPMWDAFAPLLPTLHIADAPAPAP